jgi:hypothetical protein
MTIRTRLILTVLSGVALAVLLAWYAAVAPAQADSSAKVTVGEATVGPGGTAVVGVSVTPNGGKLVGALTIDVSYDESLASATSCTPSASCNPSYDDPNTPEVETNVVRLVWADLAGLSGQVGTITFLAGDTADTTTSLSAVVVTCVDVEASPLQCSANDGSITIGPAKQPTGDTDGDGCSDMQENGPDATLGGLRDYLNFWDFFDPDMDGSVAFGDFLLLVQHFGTNDAGGTAPINRNSDPLTTPDPGSGNYHPLFDRGAVLGPNPWNVGPPDGAIGFGDFLAFVSQFGHTCAA